MGVQRRVFAHLLHRVMVEHGEPRVNVFVAQAVAAQNFAWSEVRQVPSGSPLAVPKRRAESRYNPRV
jgi:hypothetical protein